MNLASKHHRPKRYFAVICIAAILELIAPHRANALSYSAEPISAQLIDAETREGLSDVVVLVMWRLEDAGGGAAPLIRFAEAVSDASGRFTFQGWGPQVVPSAPDGRLWRLNSEQPVLVAFKPGYLFGVVSNEWESSSLGNVGWTGSPVRRSVWSGRQIQLRRFDGEKQQYLNLLSGVAWQLPLQGCRWAEIPQFTAALVNVRGTQAYFPEMISLPTIRTLEAKANDTPGCPSPRLVLGPYLK